MKYAIITFSIRKTYQYTTSDNAFHSGSVSFWIYAQQRLDGEILRRLSVLISLDRDN